MRGRGERMRKTPLSPRTSSPKSIDIGRVAAAALYYCSLLLCHVRYARWSKEASVAHMAALGMRENLAGVKRVYQLGGLLTQDFGECSTMPSNIITVFRHPRSVVSANCRRGCHCDRRSSCRNSGGRSAGECLLCCYHETNSSNGLPSSHY